MVTAPAMQGHEEEIRNNTREFLVLAA